MVAAYQSLTGLGGFCWWAQNSVTYDERTSFPWFPLPGGQYPAYTWTASTPTLVGGFPAAAVAVRRDHIARGTTVVLEARPRVDIHA